MARSSNLTTEFIITCKCTDTPKFAQESYSLLFPDKPNPVLYSTQGNIYRLADSYPNSEVQRYLKGLARSKEKFAYLFKVDETGSILELINLKTGARVQ